jgi:tRNA threonylcarbamoyladenosine biosynthesis protein TsaB
MILGLKTNQPLAELWLVSGGKPLEHYTWQANRELSTTLLAQIEQLLMRHRLSWEDLNGVVVFQGPGSFTGLRIGVTVANTLGYSLNIPVAGAQGENWLKEGVEGLREASVGTPVLPKYGAEPNITKPKQ